MAVPWIPISVGLSAAGLGGGLLSGRKAKKEREKAAREQRKQDAYHALMVAAGGGTPPAPSPVEAAPTEDWGAALSQLGAITGQVGAMESQGATDKAKLDLMAQRNDTAEAVGQWKARQANEMAAVKKTQSEYDNRVALARLMKPSGGLMGGADPQAESAYQEWLRRLLPEYADLGMGMSSLMPSFQPIQ